MVLHFVIDEKVTNQIIENFSKVDEDSRFLVFIKHREVAYRHISYPDDKLIKFIEAEDDINLLLNKLKPKAILTHAFHLEYAKAIVKIKIKLNIAWYTWGFDVYGLPRIKPHTYSILSNKYLHKHTKGLYVGRLILENRFTRKIYFSLKKGEEDRYSIIFNALNKVKFFVTYIEEDYIYFSKYYPNTFKYLNSPFSTINQYLAGNKLPMLFDDAHNVLIGNSNSIESNHLDVFSILKTQDNFKNTKFYTPLSYGDDDYYKKEVINKGKEILGSAFIPLLKFMDRNHYIAILSSCSTGIFYHYRQQAMGNIISMLYLGARIYLSTKNPSFNFFIKNGIKVFDFDKDFKEFKNTKLDLKTANNNKKQLDLIFNENKVLEDIKNLIKSIT